MNRLLLNLGICALLAFSAARSAEAQIDPNALNKAFGINFVKDSDLWDDSADDFKKRLGVRFEETKVGDDTIHTSYAKGKVLGAKIEQIRIKEDDAKVSRVDMVFFNKGDSVTGSKWTPKMQREMKEQWSALKSALDSFAGASQKGAWGVGRMKNPAQIWHFENMVFSLEFKQREFIILHITPKGAAESSGTTKITASSDFDGKANVKKSENGDVYIDNIPMVNQGAKGYCVPATMERCFKYYNIPDVDMHKIASVCSTNVGGGTTMASVMNDFKKVCNTYKLRMGTVGSFSINSISQYIDKGIPVCWTMFSTDEYTKRMIENTDHRKNEDFDAYCKRIKEQKKIPKKFEGAHVCMVIGYNKKTKELAVSNPWGERFQISWVRFDDAKIVSRMAFVINPR